jgi:hypothetical protein
MAVLDRPQMTIQNMCITCWITKATNTFSDYVIVTAYLPKLCLYEHSKCYVLTYIFCFIYFAKNDQWWEKQSVTHKAK